MAFTDLFIALISSYLSLRFQQITARLKAALNKVKTDHVMNYINISSYNYLRKGVLHFGKKCERIMIEFAIYADMRTM